MDTNTTPNEEEETKKKTLTSRNTTALSLSDQGSNDKEDPSSPLHRHGKAPSFHNEDENPAKELGKGSSLSHVLPPTSSGTSEEQTQIPSMQPSNIDRVSRRASNTITQIPLLSMHQHDEVHKRRYLQPETGPRASDLHDFRKEEALQTLPSPDKEAPSPRVPLLTTSVGGSARQLDHPYGYFIAFCAFLIQGCVFGVVNSFTVFIPLLEGDVSLNGGDGSDGKPTAVQLSLPLAVCNGAAPLLAVVGGRLADRFGPRATIFCSLLCTSAAWFTVSFIHHITLFAVAYSAFMSFAIALTLTPAAVAVTSWFSEKRVSSASGISMAGQGAGSAVVVYLAAVLSTSLGGNWRLCFRYMAVIPLLGMFPVFFIKKRQTGNSDSVPKEDTTTTTNITEELLLPEGCHETGGCSGAAPNQTHEEKEARSVLTESFSEFVKKHICTFYFAALFLSGALFSFTFFGVLYLKVIFAQSFGKSGSIYGSAQGYEAIPIQEAATLFTVFGLSMAGGSIVWGFVGSLGVKNFSVAALYVLSLFLASAGCVFWIFGKNYTHLAIVSGTLGVAFGGVWVSFTSLAGLAFAGPNAGVGIGLVMMSLSIGGFLSPLTISTLNSPSLGYTVGQSIMAATSCAGAVLYGLLTLCCSRFSSKYVAAGAKKNNACIRIGNYTYSPNTGHPPFQPDNDAEVTESHLQCSGYLLQDEMNK